MIMPHFNFSNFNLISHDQILKFVIKFVAVTSAGREWLMKLAGLGFQICTLSFFTASFNLHHIMYHHNPVLISTLYVQCTNMYHRITPYKNHHRSRAISCIFLALLSPYSAQPFHIKCLNVKNVKRVKNFKNFNFFLKINMSEMI